MKNKVILFWLTIALSACYITNAQSALRNFKIGIFAPVYLDSAFNGNDYRYSNRSFPRFTLQGLDFFQGAMIALDTLPVGNYNVIASFFDTKSHKENIDSLLVKKQFDSLDIIIGSVRDNDFLQLADVALKKNIPFISATYPNDGGIRNNPFTVILNATLKAHCEAIFAHLLLLHGDSKIYLVKKTGSQEDRINGYFKTMNEQEGKPLLKMETINIKDYDFNALVNKLDTNKFNVIVGGSLDETFATELMSSLQKLNTRSIKIIGMPNWDGFSATMKQMKDVPYYYTTPYFNFKNDTFSINMKAAYQKKYKGNPSEMAYKGFESVYLFTYLLTHYPDDFMSHLNEFGRRIFTDFLIRPVYQSKKSTPDFFENKHLYFIKVVNGISSFAW